MQQSKLRRQIAWEAARLMYSREEAEYYRFDRLQLGVKLDNADFDPDRLWPKRETKSAQAK